MSNEFHIPFLKKLIFVAFVTIFAMVSSHYVVRYYMSHNSTTVYTIQESNISSKR